MNHWSNSVFLFWKWPEVESSTYFGKYLRMGVVFHYTMFDIISFWSKWLYQILRLVPRICCHCKNDKWAQPLNVKLWLKPSPNASLNLQWDTCFSGLWLNRAEVRCGQNTPVEQELERREEGKLPQVSVAQLQCNTVYHGCFHLVHYCNPCTSHSIHLMSTFEMNIVKPKHFVLFQTCVQRIQNSQRAGPPTDSQTLRLLFTRHWLVSQFILNNYVCLQSYSCIY